MARSLATGKGLACVPVPLLPEGQYHALYTGVDAGLLGLIDDLFAHGNLRNWAAFTHSAHRLAEETGRERLDEQIARNVFALHGGGGPSR